MLSKILSFDFNWYASTVQQGCLKSLPQYILTPFKFIFESSALSRVKVSFDTSVTATLTNLKAFRPLSILANNQI